MSTSENLIPVVGFALVAACAYAVLALFDPYRLRVRSRVEELRGGDGSNRRGRVSDQTSSRTISSRLMQVGQRLNLNHTTDRPRLEQRLAQAGIHDPSAVPKYFAARLVLMILTAAAAIATSLAEYVRLDMALLLACLAGGFGAILPSIWLDRRIARHHLLLRKSLPDLLDLMTVCLEGGLSLQETIRRVGDELCLAHPALAVELNIVQRDIELGATVDQALKRFANRTDYEGVRTLSTFIREAQRFGTNITEALRSHADMLRSQREQVAEENAQKAAVKILIPTLLLIFPAVFVVAVGPAIIQIQEAFAAK